jgi:nucleotide-binding universal stress UspA family protein
VHSQAVTDEEVSMQSTQRPIVVGVDESDGVHTALSWAAHDAAVRNVAVRAVCAYHGSDKAAQLAERLIADAIDHLKVNHPDVVAEGAAIEGDAVHVLLDESKRARVVVVGASRRKGLGSSALGSVTGAVAAHSEAPVVALCGPAGLTEEGAAVVVGVDGTEASHQLLAFGFEHADVHHTAVRAVLCWYPDLLASMSWRAEPPPPESVDAWLSSTVADLRAKYPDVRVHPEVLREQPKTGLIQASEEQYLLVVGNRGKHAHAGSLLGGVSQRVLHHATCPVAVVPTHRA